MVKIHIHTYEIFCFRYLDADRNSINYKTEYLIDGRKRIYYEPTVVGKIKICFDLIENLLLVCFLFFKDLLKFIFLKKKNQLMVVH